MKKINEIFSIDNVKRIKFREDINGLRAIAVLSVVFSRSDRPLVSRSDSQSFCQSVGLPFH